MDNTIIQQGGFTSAGVAVKIPLPMGADWLDVYNFTVIGNAQVAQIASQFYWQRNMGFGQCIAYIKANQANADNLVEVVGNAVFPYDSSANPAGTLNATITAISAAAIPVVTCNANHGLIAGDVVRIINVTGAQQIGGIDFTVGYNTLTNTTFSLDYMAQIVAGTNGSWRKISFDPIYYPRRRTITEITRGATTTIALSVTHGYKVGQLVRIIVPSIYHMTEINGLQASIISVDTTVTTGNTITVNIDSSAFTAFDFPVTAAVPFTLAEIVPIGEDTASALSSGVDILSDATVNTASMGLILSPGAFGPAGQTGDNIFWKAGVSFSNTVQFN